MKPSTLRRPHDETFAKRTQPPRALLLAGASAFALGCSAGPGSVASTHQGLTAIPASQATESKLGVHEWVPSTSVNGRQEFRGLSATGQSAWVVDVEVKQGPGGQDVTFTKVGASGGAVSLHVGTDNRPSVTSLTMSATDGAGVGLLAGDVRAATPSRPYDLWNCAEDALSVAIFCGMDAAQIVVACAASCEVAGCAECVSALGFSDNCAGDVAQYVADGCAGGSDSCTPRACNQCGNDYQGNWTCTGPCGAQPDGCGGTVDCGSCDTTCSYQAINFADGSCEVDQLLAGLCLADDGTGDIKYCNADGTWTDNAGSLCGGDNQNQEVTLCQSVDCPGGPGCP